MQFTPETVFKRATELDTTVWNLDLVKGSYSPPEIGDWLTLINQIQMPSTVPAGVAKLFNTAKGAFVYGWCYYPLMSLGAEHCFKVCEAAIRHKYRELGGPPGRKRHVPLTQQILWLEKKGLFSPEQTSCWEATVLLRNHASHPDYQAILGLAQVANQMEFTVEMVTALFPGP